MHSLSQNSAIQIPMKKRPREPKPILPVLASATGPALIKHLASCNTTVRSQSLRLLQSWLASESQRLSDSDIKKLWKGLFYCLWHADKTPNQVALINRLTSMFLSLQPSLSLEFFRGFLVTLRREWPGIDRLRLDKFYLLIRRFMKALFELMRLRNWDVGVLGEFFGVLESDGFLADDKLRGNGVNYHIVSVFFEELKGVGFPVRTEVVEVILRPFFAVMTRGKDKILMGKVKRYVFDELVNMGKEVLAKKRMGVDCDEKNGIMLLGVVALRMGLAGRFYQVGSSVDCIQGNRKVIFGLHEEFLKLENDVESSGIEIAIPEYRNEDVAGDDDEVPQLIPIEGSVGIREGEGAEDVHYEDCSDKGIFKKSKKAKKGVDGDGKKRKKKKKKMEDNGVSEISFAVEENGDLARVNGSDGLQKPSDSGNGLNDNDLEIDGTEAALNETVILNLQRQFEKVSAEMGSESNDDSDSFDTLISSKHSKRKRMKGADRQDPDNPNMNVGVGATEQSVEKSAKKVRFAMKNNLVWKPQNPLPPESLRLPPSATPRGSALKKGVPPGPIVEMLSAKKKAKAKAKKKAQFRLKSATSLIKRQKKMQIQSA